MTPTEPTYKLIQAWMRAHVKFIGELTKRMQSVSGGYCGHQFDGDEEYVINSVGMGYHVEYDMDMSNGRLDFKAIPGRFVGSNVGPMWVNGRTRLHDAIEKACDHKESSLLIQ